MSELKVGIVGSRRRATLFDRKIVFCLIKRIIRELGPHVALWIVSGACPKGADHFAAEAARVLGVALREWPVPTDPPIRHRGDFRDRAFARNKLIAEDSHVLFALVHSDRTGGTEDTVKHMCAFGKPVFLVDEMGDVYLSSAEEMIKCPEDRPLPLTSRSTG